jgi:hypothetical protein
VLLRGKRQIDFKDANLAGTKVEKLLAVDAGNYNA